MIWNLYNSTSYILHPNYKKELVSPNLANICGLQKILVSFQYYSSKSHHSHPV